MLGALLVACSQEPTRPDLARLYRIGSEGADITPVIVIPGLFGSRLRNRTSGAELWPGSAQMILFDDYHAIGLDFDRTTLQVRPDDIEAFGVTDADRALCRERIASLRNEGPFTPPSLEGSLVMPSNIGGAHWGGVATDPAAQIAVVPVNTIAAMVKLIPRADLDAVRRGAPSRIGGEFARMRGTPYGMYRELLILPSFIPCTPPPFGALVGVDLRRGTVAWRVPLGGRDAGVASSSGMPRNCRKLRLSAQRQAMPRWLSMPSK